MDLIALIALLLTFGTAPLLVDANSSKNSDYYNFYESLAVIGGKTSGSLSLPAMPADRYCSPDAPAGYGAAAKCSGQGDLGSYGYRFSDYPSLVAGPFANWSYSETFWPVRVGRLCQHGNSVDLICSSSPPMGNGSMPTGQDDGAFFEVILVLPISTGSIPAGIGSSNLAAPGPLPLFGVAAAYGCSRSLRRRIQRSRVAAMGWQDQDAAGLEVLDLSQFVARKERQTATLET